MKEVEIGEPDLRRSRATQAAASRNKLQRTLLPVGKAGAALDVGDKLAEDGTQGRRIQWSVRLGADLWVWPRPRRARARVMATSSHGTRLCQQRVPSPPGALLLLLPPPPSLLLLPPPPPLLLLLLRTRTRACAYTFWKAERKRFSGSRAVPTCK